LEYQIFMFSNCVWFVFMRTSMLLQVFDDVNNTLHTHTHTHIWHMSIFAHYRLFPYGQWKLLCVCYSFNTLKYVWIYYLNCSSMIICRWVEHVQLSIWPKKKIVSKPLSSNLNKAWVHVLAKMLTLVMEGSRIHSYTLNIMIFFTCLENSKFKIMLKLCLIFVLGLLNILI
jgi:hypothetical protein